MFSVISSLFSKTRPKFYLVLDVGTTGVKGIIFDDGGAIKAKAYRLIKKSAPQPGWVEQDPLEMVAKSIEVIREALLVSALAPADIVSCGLTNQRETIIMWDKRNGLPVYPAIVWEDDRAKDWCAAAEMKYGELVRRQTGLPVEPYFSASKIHWLLENLPAANQLEQDGELMVGTVDSWILWNLSDEAAHATDYTNAARTLLFDIKAKVWGQELLDIFSVPGAILPVVKDSSAHFGTLRRDIIGGEIPIRAMAGDQAASAVAAGLERGVTKVTYGTGAFISQGLGRDFILYDGFYTTLVPGEVGPGYALEAKVSGYGDQVGKYLNDPAKLKEVLVGLAGEVAQVLARLPLPFVEVIADGGITQAEFLLTEQERVSGVKMVKQKIYDGTALGVLYLLQDFKKGP